MLTVDMILKKAMKGQMDLMTHAMAVAEEITGVPDFGMPPTDVFEAHLAYVENFKKAVLLVAGAAVQKLMQTLAKEQEVLMHIADMLSGTAPPSPSFCASKSSRAFAAAKRPWPTNSP